MRAVIGSALVLFVVSFASDRVVAAQMKFLLGAVHEATDESVASLFERGAALLEAGDLKNARTALETALEKATGASTKAQLRAFIGVANLAGECSVPEIEASNAAFDDPALAPTAALDALELLLAIRPEAAEPVALRLVKNLNGSSLQCRALSDYASSLAALKRFDDAAKEYEAAALAAEATTPEARCLVLLQASDFFMRHGQLDAALKYARDAEAAPPPENLRAVVAGQLGAVLLRRDQFGQAREAFERVRRCAEEANDDALLVPALKGLAEVEAKLGNPKGALELRKRVLDRTKPGTLDRARHEQDVGTAFEGCGDVLEARTRYEKAAVAFQAAHDARDAAMARVNLGRMLRLAGLAADALREQRNAVELARSAADPRIEGAAQCGIAEDLIALRDATMAKEAALKARDLARQCDAVDDEIYALEALTAAALLGRASGEAAQHLTAVEALLDREDMAALSRSEASGVRSRFPRLSELAQDLCTLRLLGSEQKEHVLEDAMAAAARWKGRALLEGRAGRRLSSTELLPADWRERIGALLGDEGVYVEYVAGRDSLYAFVIHGTEFERIDLGDRASVIGDVATYVDRLLSIDTHVDEMLAQGHDLFRRLVEPVFKVVNRIPSTLVIVPLVEFARLPFESLVTKPGADFATTTYLDNVVACLYSPSAPMLLELSRRTDTDTQWSLLVSLSDHASGEDLPDAWTELQTVAPLLLIDAGADDALFAAVDKLDRLGSELDREPLRIRVGTHATWNSLKDLRGGFRFIHFATHARVDLDDASRSAVFLAPTAEHDGKMRLADIENAPFHGQLVFLACCDTAVGPARRGEGVASLANAFFVSGSRSVIATLWQVYDEKMPRLASTFYTEHVEKHASCAAALRAARASLRSRTRGTAPDSSTKRVDLTGHPHYWAQCVLIGGAP